MTSTDSPGTTRDLSRPPAVAPPCRICGGMEGTPWLAREMMFGLREEFSYLECGTCGCLQISVIPTDLSPYYRPDYYSFESRPRARGIVARLRRSRNEYAFTGRGTVGRVLHLRSPYPIPGMADWLARTGSGTNTRVLDVGSGNGHLVRDLADAGFPRPLGIDPFVERDRRYPEGASVLKREIGDVSGEFDLVVFNHSLEHVPDPIATLAAVRTLLAPSGLCVARMPTVSSFAWEHYRTDWVQLDAPRHLHIHSIESLSRAGAAAGLTLDDVVYDSTERQFSHSEMYRRDIAFVEATPDMSRRELRRYRRRARELNEAGRGDQATFYLRGG